MMPSTGFGDACLRLLLAFSCVSRSLAAQSTSPVDAAEEARQLIRNGQPEKAIPIYEELVRSYPTNAEILVDLSIAEFGAKRFVDAAGSAKEAVRLKPDLGSANLFLGASELKLGNYAAAVEALEKAVRVMSTDRNAHLLLGEALVGTGNFERALVCLRALSEQLPGSSRVWFALGHAYDGLADTAGRELLARWPDSSYAQIVSGDLYVKRHFYGSAFEAYRSALSKPLSLSGVHHRIAQIYAETGHAEWSRREESVALNEGPAKPDGSAAAVYYSSLLKYQQLAETAYGHLQVLPPSRELRMHQAATLDIEGRYSEAASEWRSALKFSPQDPAATISLGRSLFNAREFSDSLAVFAEFLKKNPASAEANFLSGASLLNLQQPAAALPFLQAAIAIDKDMDPAAAALGQTLLLTGQPEPAIAFLKRSIGSDQDGNVHFQLFRAYQLTGEHELAKEAFGDYSRFRAWLDEKRRFEDGAHLPAPSQ